MASFSASVFPASNLAPQAQEWRAAVERRVSILEERDTSRDARRIMSRWGATLGAASTLDEKLDDLATLAGAASAKSDDALSWHEVPPVSPGPGVDNPDIPVNPNATWYVCELSPGGVGVDKDRVKEVWQWNAPGTESGGQMGKWVQQRWGTDTLGEGAVDYKNLAAAARGDLEAAKALKGRVDTLSASYEQTKADLEQAKKDVAKAVAGAKDVIISDTEPTGADRKPGNLWVSTAGGTTKLYVFDGDKNAWVLVEGDDAAQAAAAAAEAQKKAKEALDKAQAVEDIATAAKLAAQRAQASADGKNTIFYQANKPTLNGRTEGDLWYDTDDGYKMYRYYAQVDDFVVASIGASSLEGSVTPSVASNFWNNILDAGAPKVRPVGGDMIARQAITTVHVQGLDAGVITSGFIGSDRIAARSITAAQMAAGTITAESGVIGSLNANDIKFGTLSGDRIDANTLRGKLIEGGTLKGGTIEGGTITGGTVTGGRVIGTTISGGSITGSTITINREGGANNRVTIDTVNGITVWKGSTVYARMDPSLPNGLALYNPNSTDLFSNLTDVSSIIFGAQFKSKVLSPAAPSSVDGAYGYSWLFNAPASGRALIIAQIHYSVGAQSPLWRGLSIQRERNSGVWMTTAYLYASNGWQSDTPMFMGLATGLPKEGKCTVWTKIAFSTNGAAPFTRWETSFATAALIPC